MRIRMLKDIAAKAGVFKAGQSYEVEDLTARSWIGFRLAEQDKMIDAAPETKVVPASGVMRVSAPNVTLEVNQGTSPHPVPPPGIVVPVKRDLVHKILKKKK